MIMDNGFDSRAFRQIEGFNYTTSQLRAVYPTYSGLPEIDTTTLPGRSCLSLPAGSYINLNIPRVDGTWSPTVFNTSRLNVMQAKLYLDADSYTSVSADSLLIAYATNAGFTWLTGAGLSADSAVNQDRWYLRQADVATNIAINNPRMELPIISQRTWVDFKVVIYPYSTNDAFMAIFVNNYVVAWSNTADLMDQANSDDFFYGLRLYGLANQTGPTLWRDVMFYQISNSSYRTNFVGDFYTPVTSLTSGSIAATILQGQDFVPMTACVYDITPETTDNAVNQFVTLGTGSPINALSNIDTNQYVTSSAPGQDFRLRVGHPDQATGDNSTAITITDDSEVLAYSYSIRAKDLNGSNSNMIMRVGDETALDYRFRYYKLRLGYWQEGNTDLTSHYLQQIYFTDASLARIVPSVGATMRMDNVNGIPAVEIDPVDRTVNTTLFTQLLTNTNAATNIAQGYLRAFRYTGISLGNNPTYYMDLHIDYGVGNAGPDWYSLAVNQTQSASACRNMILYGSDDASDWYLLAELTNLPASQDVSYIINRRHPSYTSFTGSGTVQNISPNFVLNAAQFDQVTEPAEGDPLSAGNPSYPGQVPSLWKQFKNYTIGLREQ